jgi:DNA-binding PadR family transcriptional regulator
VERLIKKVDNRRKYDTISVSDISETDIQRKIMSHSTSDIATLLPLTPAVFHIMLALADQERHGYDIMREVTAMTLGKVLMGPGTLYGTIKRMLHANLIEESGDRPVPELDDERRRYYRLTAFGKKVLLAEAQRLSSLVQVAQTKNVLGGETG